MPDSFFSRWCRRAWATLTGTAAGTPAVPPAESIPPAPATGSVTVNDAARVHGVIVGTNLGTVIYQRAPSDDERHRLVWYLEGLAEKMVDLPLRGLDERLSHGQCLALPHVYVTLATATRIEVACGTAHDLHTYFEDADPQRPLKRDYDPDYALPDVALYRGEGRAGPEGRMGEIVLQRACTAVAAVQRHTCLALLGDPGGGKSTFVRHLAWALAQRELNFHQAPALTGWDERRTLLPILVPLRTLAGRLARDGSSNATVYATLRDELHTYCTHQIDDALSAALSRGATILLFDGLDEVPLEGTPDVADRLTTVQAVRAIARRYDGCPTVLTCRTRAFSDELRAELGWPVETLAPFTLGQIRYFVPAWYRELVAKGQIDQAQADHLSTGLIAAIGTPARPRLRAMAGTPLLLTLMALVLYNKGELPRDRPQLYERILELLLGQWDEVRAGQSLGQALGKPEWNSSYIRPLLDALSYQAHAGSTSADGRGRLERGVVYTALIDFFKQAKVNAPGDAALRCLEYIEQRSGLLLPDGATSFVFAHLTLQEHCAGRQLALNTDDPVALVLEHRTDDRWREPIFLGVGLMPPLVLDRLLHDLLEREAGNAPKSAVRWYRDLILAAEIGADRDWTYLRTRPQVRVERVQHALRAGLVTLLADSTQPLSATERVRAGFLLGDLGDPRCPVTVEEWRAEWARAGQPGSYFCRVEPGSYQIGSADDDPAANDSEKPQHTVTLEQPLYVARYPLTNAQWQAWVAQASGQSSYFADNANLNRPNQPVVGLSWQMSNAFCAWLSEQIGVSIRLPTEQEWEAAARSSAAQCYPWGDDWRDDHAATEEDRETRGWEWSVPVGCYPAGASPCGALDMAGNVWEWTASVYQSYPGAAKVFTEAARRVLRGGGYADNRTNVRCGARGRYGLGNVNNGLGFRVVLAPRSHKGSDF